MKKILQILSAVLLIGAFLMLPAGLAYAADVGDPCKNRWWEGTEQEAYYKEMCDNTDPDVAAIVKTVLNSVYVVVGVVAVVFIIIGGVRYTTAYGDPGRIAKAKNTILYAVIGLIVAIAAFAITQFVIDAMK